MTERRETHRFAGPANYRGWALRIDTDPKEPGVRCKRWRAGNPLWACVIDWLGFHLHLAPRTFMGERVLRISIIYVDGEADD